MKIFGIHIGRARQETPPVLSVDDLPKALDTILGGSYTGGFDGSKFLGGFGPTYSSHADYWVLRKRSAMAFNQNLYGRGIVRRLITNEINTGLMPEAMPEESLIGLDADAADEWADTVETRFELWGKNPRVCDWKESDTFGMIQRKARQAALVSGDVLVVLKPSKSLGVPRVQLVAGDHVRTPWIDNIDLKLRAGHTIQHGVELDPEGRHVAFWIYQSDGSFKRQPATGASGRKLAWLVYGTDKRLDEVRGQPLLSIVLQSLQEIDRYRDAVLRKAVINSILALFIKKTDDKPGTRPISGGALRKGTVEVPQLDGTPRRFNIAELHPGAIIDELQVGEEPVAFSNQGVDEKLGDFESAVIHAVAWALEIPPEILQLAFSNNYSASQAAINEFKIYLNRVWAEWGDAFCTPIYVDWLISETLRRKINAPGFISAWRNPAEYDVFGAWTAVDWYGSIKPSTDMLKQAKGSALLVGHGWSTNARESRGLTGTKYGRNVRRLRRENMQLVEANRPLVDFRKETGVDLTAQNVLQGSRDINDLAN